MNNNSKFPITISVRGTLDRSKAIGSNSTQTKARRGDGFASKYATLNSYADGATK